MGVPVGLEAPECLLKRDRGVCPHVPRDDAVRLAGQGVGRQQILRPSAVEKLARQRRAFTGPYVAARERRPGANEHNDGS